MTNRIDLHTHSSVSDGTYSPAALACLAHEKGLSAVALTDHDTVDGTAEFRAACENYGIESVSGIELNASYEKEMHIIGLFVNENDKDLLAALDKLRDGREKRNAEMVKKLCENGIDISEDDIRDAKDGAPLREIGRPHIARAVINNGFAESIPEVFEKYIAVGKPCYVERLRYSPEECINMIHEAGGIAVLAHPIFISADGSVLAPLLAKLTDMGLDGMECRHSAFDRDFSLLAEKLCSRFGLLRSGGSDFHGENKPTVLLGEPAVPYEYIEAMKAAEGKK